MVGGLILVVLLQVCILKFHNCSCNLWPRHHPSSQSIGIISDAYGSSVTLDMSIILVMGLVDGDGHHIDYFGQNKYHKGMILDERSIKNKRFSDKIAWNLLGAPIYIIYCNILTSLNCELVKRSKTLVNTSTYCL